ncbi:MAG TPA: hypothetical protein VFU05_05745 [Cyclobacteriaceae bacterium]|nr:hypothetical protein [Cyclobacteriaceae bacterium]
MKKGFFLLMCIPLLSFAPPRLVKTKITDDITVLIPKNFRPMDELDFTQRYPSVRQPIGAYTNEAREVDFSVNISATQWPDGDVEIAKEFFKSGVVNMFDGVDMIEEGIHTVGGKQFIFFEFESRVKGDRSKLDLTDPVLNYTYIQYLVEPKRTLVFSFSCPRRIREDWQPTARKMMKGIKVK